MKCERCNSSNVRRSSWKRNERDKIHFVYAPYRCRDCEHRFFRVSRTFMGTVAGGVALVAFLGFVVSVYIIAQPPELTPALAAESDFDPGKKALFARAEKGKAEDQYAVGLMLLRGDGVAQNYGEAIKWFERAAQQNHPDAALNLGLLYKNGRGVLQDFTIAGQWFEKAARQRHPEAEYHLGTLYKVGEGVKHDMKQAYAWYNLAAAHGYEPALTARQTITTFMSAAEVAEAQALSRTLNSPVSSPPTATAKP
jgi:uncharacterized protein